MLAQFLQQIAQLHFLPVAAALQREAGGGKARWAEADDRVARKAEAFARYAHKGIELAVAIGIVNHRHGIVAGRKRRQAQLAVACRDRALDRAAAVATIREFARGGRDADLEQPARRAQAGEIKLQRRQRRGAGQQRQPEQRRARPAHGRTAPTPGPSRTAGPRTGNKVHNCTHTARDGADDGSP